MRATVLISLAVATATVMGVTSFRLFLQLRSERERVWMGAARIQALQAAQTRLEHEVAVLRVARNPPPSSAVSLLKPQPGDPSAVSANAASPQDENRRVANFRQAVAGLLDDPVARRMLGVGQRMGIQMAYGDLLKELKLSPGQADRFMQVLADQQAKALKSAREHAGDPQALAAAGNAAQAQTDAALSQVLDPEQIQKYEDYRKSLPERMQVASLSRQLSATSAPLREEQRQGLLAAMIEEKTLAPPPLAPDGSPSSVMEQLQWQNDYNRRVRERAGQILTDEQLKPLEQLQSMQLSIRRMVEGVAPGAAQTEAVPGR